MIKTLKIACVSISLFLLLVCAMLSCKKSRENERCDVLRCLNNGVCIDGACKCPAGYEGDNCGTKWIQKYIGTKSVSETYVTPAFDTAYNAYDLYITASKDSTKLFFNNFWGFADCSLPGFILDGPYHFFFTPNVKCLYLGTYDYIIKSGEGFYDPFTGKIKGYYLMEFDEINGNYDKKYTVYFEMQPD